MGKQKIEVIVNCPDEEELQKMMAKAIAEIVIERVNRLYRDNSDLVIEKLLKDCEYERE